jgi:hypothetical protein
MTTYCSFIVEMNCFFASSDMTNRILFELVKLTSEVRQLRRVVEKQSVNRRAPTTSAQDFIPELVDGPVTSIKDSRALLKSCAQKPQQDFLVSTFTNHFEPKWTYNLSVISQ